MRTTTVKGERGCPLLEHFADPIFSITHEFIANGLKHANALLGYAAFKLSDWDIIGEYSVSLGAHRAFVAPQRDMTIEGAKLKKGERIRIEESYKFSGRQARSLFRTGGVTETLVLTNDVSDARYRYGGC